jgi:homoserine O-acetyltransferase/O-succinyltransferase
VKQFEAYPTRQGADAWYQRITTSAYQVDVNDALYQYEASSDYNPSPDLEKIKAKLLAIEFEDDQVNCPQFAALDHEMPRVKNGRYVIVAASKQGNGEGGKYCQRRIVGGSFARVASRLAPLVQRRRRNM